MSKFKVVEIRKMEASRMTGMTLGEDLSWREVNSDYLSFRDGVRINTQVRLIKLQFGRTSHLPYLSR